MRVWPGTLASCGPPRRLPTLRLCAGGPAARASLRCRRPPNKRQREFCQSYDQRSSGAYSLRSSAAPTLSHSLVHTHALWLQGAGAESGSDGSDDGVIVITPESLEAYRDPPGYLGKFFLPGGYYLGSGGSSLTPAEVRALPVAWRAGNQARDAILTFYGPPDRGGQSLDAACTNSVGEEVRLRGVEVMSIPRRIPPGAAVREEAGLVFVGDDFSFEERERWFYQGWYNHFWVLFDPDTASAHPYGDWV